MRPSNSPLRALGLAVLLAGSASAQNLTAILANLEHFWSYGRSPAVYPTPEMSGTGGWAESLEFAKAMVAQMTNMEKNNITFGYASTTNGASGNIPPIERLGFTGLALSDSGNGVRGTDGVNGYPAGIHIGATWSRDLALQRAQFMGAEFKAKGVNVALGPVAGPLGRIAEGGRNWEGFSNDPMLSGALTYETIIGYQESVIACVKHFILNEQETNRNPQLTNPKAHNVSVSSNADSKTIHELYLWPFQDAIKAGAGSVMCIYNQFNGSYGCQNSYLMNGLLKQELGFQGFVVTDWGALHTGIAAAEAGLDMVMPSSEFWENNTLAIAVANGTLEQTRLDDMVTRIVAAWHRFGQVDNLGAGMPISVMAPHEFIDARDPAANAILLQSAVEGHVLVKNTNNSLPLSKPKLLSLFGYDGIAQAQNTPYLPGGYKWTFGLNNIQSFENFGNFNDTYLFDAFLSSVPWDSPVPAFAWNGTLFTGGGSGATTPAYIDAPFDAFMRQAKLDGTFMLWDFYNPLPYVNQASDACIVFINAAASEGWDRMDGLSDSYSDNLVEHVASQCANTHVVIHNAGIRVVDSFQDNPNVTSIIFAHLPGQDSGEALVEIMYGKQSPSGRLPYTVAKTEADYGNLLRPVVPDSTTMYHTQDNFTEGVYIDYRHFIAQNITPRYEFGFGLTYSEFSYSNLQTESTSSTGWTANDNSAFIEGGDPALWDVIASVSATIQNTGDVAAAEVAQLYVNIPGGPAKQLRGFQKELLQPGESSTVTFELNRRDLSIWDEGLETWVVEGGEYAVYVGKSVLDVQLEGSISV